MEALRFLALTVLLMSSHGSADECKEFDMENISVVEGEALYFVPYALKDPRAKGMEDDDYVWYKVDSTTQPLSSEEEERVHHHGGKLFIFNMSTEDSGLYISRHSSSSGRCYLHKVKITVLPKSQRFTSSNLYGEVNISKVRCPDPVRYVCRTMNGNLTWYKDCTLLPGKYDYILWVNNATTADSGIYTCFCTWIHNGHVHNSSASRKMEITDPVVLHKLQIISPSNPEQLAKEGSWIKLNCTVFCGKNVRHGCDARWIVNDMTVKGQKFSNIIENTTKNSFFTAVLRIPKVSSQDFQTEFKCYGRNDYSVVSTTLTLKRQESITPLVVGVVCVVVVCVIVAVMVKCFVVDLALLFRRYFPLCAHREDSKVYDAYVIYQTPSADKASEKALCHFVTNVLPSVLEQKCGYRLFIHGRDDIPGEDRLELVEARMKLSRRLMVILTPGSGSGSEVSNQHHAFPQNPVVEGYDWQVGIHHVLVQREMSVILIQLGDFGPQGHAHLPPGLQHLVRKSPPLRWPEGSRGATMWNSGFWKRVRYMMPATPAKKQHQSAVV